MSLNLLFLALMIGSTLSIHLNSLPVQVYLGPNNSTDTCCSSYNLKCCCWDVSVNPHEQVTIKDISAWDITKQILYGIQAVVLE